MNWIAIRHEYETTRATLKELSDKYEVKPTTMRSRKTREKWQKTEDAAARPSKKAAATIRAKKRRVKAKRKVAKIIDGNPQLTDREMRFCFEYLKEFNATKAYLSIRNTTRTTAGQEGSQLLKKPHIRAALEQIKVETSTDSYIEVSDIMNEWRRQAFSNMTDFVEFGYTIEHYVDSDGVPIVDEDGKEKEYKRSFVNFKNMEDVDGAAIQEVRMGKDGPIIKLFDKQRALIELDKRVGKETELKTKFMQAQIDRLMRELEVDTSTEDKMMEFFSKLGGELDGIE